MNTDYALLVDEDINSKYANSNNINDHSINSDASVVTKSSPKDNTTITIKDEEENITIPKDILSGLTDNEVSIIRSKYGYNEIVEKKQSNIIKFLMYFTGSIAYLIEAAIILSAILRDWTDFGVILGLLISNALIGFIEEVRAESAINALKNTLALQSKVIRNKKLIEIPSRELVPGDIINLRLGDVIPADCKLLGINLNGEVNSYGLSIDQSGLTGESLPVRKNNGDSLMGSSIVKQGQSLAIVTNIGEKTFIGRAAHLISISKDAGHFQKLIARVGNFLILITLVMVFILVLITIFVMKRDPLDSIQYALVLIIASIPVGLPTVMSVTMAVGSKQLAKKKVIVKKLQAVEQMASINILCSDKTGTLTLNELTLDKPWINDGHNNNELLETAYFASEAGTSDAIELCIRDNASKVLPQLKNKNNVTVLSYVPFDPISKYSRATILYNNKYVFNVAKGAPQVILKLSKINSLIAKTAIVNMARGGLRSLGVAKTKPLIDNLNNRQLLMDQLKNNDNNSNIIEWDLIGMLSIFDPPRIDSAITIQKCKEYGISCKMITGDALLIAKEVAKRLGIHRNILSPNLLMAKNHDNNDNNNEELIKQQELEISNRIAKCDGFAQVVPEDKYRVVKLLQNLGHRVAMTGDGVNDAPALKVSDVGIAVHNCTDAARSAADIVLMEPGLGAIVDGILASRAIFQRMRSYALYRITSTIHFLLFLFFAIILFNFFIPPILIVFITLLNDAATIFISWDNASISKRPDKWRLGQLISMSIIMRILLALFSFAHYLIGIYIFNISDDIMGTIMYLQLSSSPHFVIFSTRVEDYFFRNYPSLIFFIAIFGTQVFAMFISIYGSVSSACGWYWGLSVMGTSLLFFIFLDIIKVQVYKYWSFQLTVKLWPTTHRKLRLQNKLQRKIIENRAKLNWNKLKPIILMVRVAMKMRHYQRIRSNSLLLDINNMHI